MNYRLAGICRAALAVALTLAWLFPANSIAAAGLSQLPGTSAPAATGMPGWLEPSGLNVVDLVGFVPDEYLKGAIISFATGIVQYDSGTRSGDQVTLHVRISPRILADYSPISSRFECIGQRPYADSWATVAPSSRMKLYANGADITSQVSLWEYFQGGPVLPINNSGGATASRYAMVPGKLTFDSGWAIIPANRGCMFYVPGQFDTLTADFVFSIMPEVSIMTLGQEHFQFSSYIGPGNVGWFKALMDQLQAGWGNRHSKFNLNVPSDANYLFVNYPPMAVDAYTGCCTRSATGDVNIGRPSGGTYRIGNENGQLSVDLTASMGIPIGGQWQDTGGTAYLPHFSDGRILAAPEYVVPPGMAFQPCMRDGGCPASLINQIMNAKTPITVTYLAVTRISPNLQRVPLRQVGSNWSPGMASVGAAGPGSKSLSPADYKYHFYFPATRLSPVIPPDDPSGCPCGWFTDDGRMVSYIPNR